MVLPRRRTTRRKMVLNIIRPMAARRTPTVTKVVEDRANALLADGLQVLSASPLMRQWPRPR